MVLQRGSSSSSFGCIMLNDVTFLGWKSRGPGQLILNNEGFLFHLSTSPQSSNNNNNSHQEKRGTLNVNFQSMRKFKTSKESSKRLLLKVATNKDGKTLIFEFYNQDAFDYARQHMIAQFESRLKNCSSCADDSVSEMTGDDEHAMVLNTNGDDEEETCSSYDDSDDDSDDESISSFACSGDDDEESAVASTSCESTNLPKTNASPKRRRSTKRLVFGAKEDDDCQSTLSFTTKESGDSTGTSDEVPKRRRRSTKRLLFGEQGGSSSKSLQRSRSTSPGPRMFFSAKQA